MSLLLRPLALVALLAGSVLGQDRPDLVIADFEGERYAPWVVQGEAFGMGPARGTLSGQMAVEGFEGRGLVNSYRGGDASTGTLTSPPFRVDRRFLSFLIGGGRFPGETCLDLLVGGAVVRTATGPNDRPGGSERLDWASWDVTDLVGKSVVLRVVDNRGGSWGHILVDQIVQSDRSRGVVATSREVEVKSPYLLLPVDEKAPMRRLKLSVEGQVARDFDIKLAEDKPEFTSYLDLTPFRGKRLRIETDLPVGSKTLDQITQGDQATDPTKLYREASRPQFHFTAKRGWLNDPNGLVFLDGEYHLFYQHNPYGWDWGNMHWGHAVSPDLMHWTELPIALYPRQYGDWAFSGSAVVDRKNTSGFGTKEAPPLVAAYTSTGRGECIVFSLDKGRTWSEYAGNPVVRHTGRDPRLLWHEPTKRWVMAVYDEEEARQDIVFYSSPDLKNWTKEGRTGGFFECPDLFELRVVEGNPGGSSWVLSAADGGYLLGQFDGKSFTPELGAKRRIWYGNFYAAQTFSDEPKGRRVQIGWSRGILFPGQPFNQQMTVPCELSLRVTHEGTRMFAMPVAEIELLRTGKQLAMPEGDAAGDGRLVKLGPVGDLLDIQASCQIRTAGMLTLSLPGVEFIYDATKQMVRCGEVLEPLAPVGGSLQLRVLVDQASVEIFVNNGRLAISRPLAEHTGSDRSLTMKYEGEGRGILSLEVHELKSSWR